MSQEKPSEGFKRALEAISELSKYVGTVLAYLTALCKLSPEYPYLVSILTVILTTIIVWRWRWSQISKTYPHQLVTPVEHQEASAWDAFWDIFRSGSRNSYVTPLLRRRMEFGALLSLTMLAAFTSVQDAPKAYEEISGLECSYAELGNAPRVVIAKFYNVSGLEFAFEQNMFSEVISRAEGRITICLYAKEIKNIKDARELAGSDMRTIIIWGVSDLDAFQIKINRVGGDPLAGKGLYDSSWKASPETAKYLREWAITYISQFVVIYGEIQSQFEVGKDIDNDTGKKIRELKATLDDAITQPWVVGDEKQLTPAYVYLALLLELKNDQTGALDAYNKALAFDENYDAALLNRGSLFSLNEEYDLAMKDFNKLIENGSDLAAVAYVNRSGLQSDWQNQRSDLLQAIKIEPEEAYYYHILGVFALFALDFETAQNAYQDSLKYLDAATRDQFVDDLSLYFHDTELEAKAADIAEMLQNADLPE